MEAGGESGLQVRRAVGTDAGPVNALLSKELPVYTERFGHVSVGQLIETAFTSLVAVDQGEVVAFLCLTDTPATPGLDADVATQYLQQGCKAEEVKVRGGWVTKASCSARGQQGACAAAL